MSKIHKIFENKDHDDFLLKHKYREALEKIENLTKNSSNGEIYKIHEIVKQTLKK